jgi:hypothetical protein
LCRRFLSHVHDGLLLLMMMMMMMMGSSNGILFNPTFFSAYLQNPFVSQTREW